MDNARFNKILLGALLADAHAMPFHWNYDPERIATLLDSEAISLDRLNSGDVSDYFMGKKLGEQTHHGDQIVHLYKYLLEKGTFDSMDYATHWQSYIKDYKWHIDASSKGTLGHLAFDVSPTGADSSDFCGVAMGMPLIILDMENETQVLANVQNRTEMTHNNTLTEDTARWFIKSLFLIAQGNSVMWSMDVVANTITNSVFQNLYKLGKELSKRNDDIDLLIREVGLGCGIELGLPILFALVDRHQSDYLGFIMENSKAGADASSRALIGGALIAADEKTILPEALLKQLLFKIS